MFEFFDQVIAWFDKGIYEFFRDAYAYWMLKFTEYKIKSYIFTLDAAWQAGKQILTQLNVSGELNALMSNLDPNTQSILNFFRVPEGINLVVNAFATRIVMRFTL